MSLTHSPSIVTSNLLMALDPANTKSYNSAENLLRYSEQAGFSGVWGLGDVSVTANAIAAPDGTYTADKLVESTTAGAYHYTNQVLTKPATALVYTYSLYVKDAGRTAIGIRLDDNAGNGAVVTYNVSTGATITAAGPYGTFTNASATITSVGNGWYRISLTATTSTSTNLYVQDYLWNVSANNSVYTGDGTSGIYVWGAQLEQNSVATTYNQTVATAIAKTTTMVDVSGSGKSGTIVNAPSFVNNALNFGTIANTSVRVGSVTSGSDNTYDIWCNITTLPSTGNVISLLWDDNNVVGGDSYFNIDPNGYIVTVFNFVSKYSTSALTTNRWYNINVVADSTIPGWKIYINGVLDATYSGGAAGSRTGISYVTIGQGYDGNSYIYGNSFNGLIGATKIYGRALSAAEVLQNFNALRGRYGI